MEALWQGIDNLASWPVLVAILIGSVGGLAIGAVPGIGPAIAIAIHTAGAIGKLFSEKSSLERIKLKTVLSGLGYLKTDDARVGLIQAVLMSRTDSFIATLSMT